MQPHAGAQANAAVYHALCEPGDTVLGMKLDHGGHLTHGMKINFSGQLYDIVAYGVREEDSLLDYDELERLAKEHQPKMILAGWSAYPRQLDFQRFRDICDEVGALLFVDMAHFAGLVAAGEHPNPVPYADVVSTDDPQDDRRRSRRDDPLQGGVGQEDQLGRLPGPAGRPADARDRRQGGRAQDRGVRDLPRAPAAHARRARASSASSCSRSGVNVLTGGTDVHLVLVDLRDSDLDGQQAEDRLHEIGITVNRNAVPFDPRPPAVSSGLRVGSPALATRGLQDDDFREVGEIMATALTADWNDSLRGELSDRVRAIADRYPLYPQMSYTGAGAPA